MFKPSWKTQIILLPAALAFALIANWAVLQLFGQKSADRAEHSLVGIVLLMLFIALLARQQRSFDTMPGVFGLALVPCYLGTMFPDLDITLLGIGGHRNPLFHSSLSFFLLWCCVIRAKPFWRVLVMGYGVGLASHLWWDVVYYGDVRWISGGMLDRAWLSIHGLLSLVFAGTGVRHESQTATKRQQTSRL